MRMVIILCLFFITNLSAIAQYQQDTIRVVKGFSTFYTRNNQLLTARDLLEITKPNTAAYKEMRIGKSNKNFATILVLTGGFMIGLPLGAALAGGDPNWPLAAIGSGLFVLSLPFSASYNKHATKAVRLYNADIGN